MKASSTDDEESLFEVEIVTFTEPSAEARRSTLVMYSVLGTASIDTVCQIPLQGYRAKSERGHGIAYATYCVEDVRRDDALFAHWAVADRVGGIVDVDDELVGGALHDVRRDVEEKLVVTAGVRADLRAIDEDRGLVIDSTEVKRDVLVVRVGDIESRAVPASVGVRLKGDTRDTAPRWPMRTGSKEG